MCSRGEAGTANVAFLGSGGVVSTSSAFRFPLAVSERPGEDMGVRGTAPSDAVAAAATREREGMGAEAPPFDDEEDAIGGLALDLRELLRGLRSCTRGTSCCMGTTLPIIDMWGSYKLEATGTGS